MAASLAFVAFSTIFVLALAEFLLSEEQKSKTVTATLRAWDFLDDLAKLSFLNWLRRRKAQWAIAAVAALLPALFWKPGIDTVSALLLALVALVTIGAGPLLIAFAVGGGSALSVLGRTVLVVASIFLVFLAIQFAVTDQFLPEPDYDHARSLDENVATYGAKVLASEGWVIINAIGVVLFSIVVVLSLIIVAPLALIFLARAVLTILEFLLRRIAEYPRGPVVAISGLVSAAIAYMKSFG